MPTSYDSMRDSVLSLLSNPSQRFVTVCCARTLLQSGSSSRQLGAKSWCPANGTAGDRQQSARFPPMEVAFMSMVSLIPARLASEKLLKAPAVARLLGVDVDTVKRWSRE